MIIDIHGNAVAMAELYSLKAHIFGERGWGLGNALPSDDALRQAAVSHIAFLDAVGTDIQLVAPRPYMLPCREEPELVALWVSRYNEAIARQCAYFPDRLFGLAALPQAVGTRVTDWLDELDRCLDGFGFVGAVINPDPGEGDGSTPGLGHRFWYPLWERLVAKDVPAIVVAGVSRAPRQSYSGHYITEADTAILSLLENDELFAKFPNLRLIIGYGAGSIPYQIDRWRARRWRQPTREPFDVSLRRLWFDTVVHAPASLAMLLDVCGADRCLFGTQRPGAASVIHPGTGRAVDDLKPVVESVSTLMPEQRLAIFEGNARVVFPRLAAKLAG
jgi:4-oxalmesaconate hydratase